jgi:hypothetical protein
MLLYQARTAAVTGDRKPSALQRSGGSSATGGTAANADRHSPPGKPPDTSASSYHEMPREQQEAAGNAAGPHRRMAWRKTAKESARTDRLRQRSGPYR